MSIFHIVAGCAPTCIDEFVSFCTVNMKHHQLQDSLSWVSLGQSVSLVGPFFFKRDTLFESQIISVKIGNEIKRDTENYRRY